jgi:hypothetical protein
MKRDEGPHSWQATRRKRQKLAPFHQALAMLLDFWVLS